MYHPSQLISGKEDAANNFSRGYNSVGRSMVEETMQAIRKEAERCEDRPQGFFLFHSLGGGTGSGFASRLSEQLQNEVSQYILTITVELVIEDTKYLPISICNFSIYYLSHISAIDMVPLKI